MCALHFAICQNKIKLLIPSLHYIMCICVLCDGRTSARVHSSLRVCLAAKPFFFFYKQYIPSSKLYLCSFRFKCYFNAVYSFKSQFICETDVKLNSVWHWWQNISFEIQLNFLAVTYLSIILVHNTSFIFQFCYLIKCFEIELILCNRNSEQELEKKTIRFSI